MDAGKSCAKYSFSIHSSCSHNCLWSGSSDQHCLELIVATEQLVSGTYFGSPVILETHLKSFGHGPDQLSNTSMKCAMLAAYCVHDLMRRLAVVSASSNTLFRACP